MSRIWIASIALLSMCVLTASSAMAGEGKGDKEGRRQALLEKFDADGDGQLNEAEKAKAKEAFAARRGGGEAGKGPAGKGPAGKGEAGKGKGPRGGERPSREEIIAKFDADGDGTLNEKERGKAREAMMKRRGGAQAGRGGPDGQRPSREEVMKKFDADGDGELNEKERAKLREAIMKRRGGTPGEAGKGRGPGGKGPGGFSREDFIKKFDSDGDGELSAEERAKAREEMEKRRGKAGKGRAPAGKGGKKRPEAE